MPSTQIPIHPSLGCVVPTHALLHACGRVDGTRSTGEVKEERSRVQGMKDNGKQGASISDRSGQRREPFQVIARKKTATAMGRWGAGCPKSLASAGDPRT